MYFSNPRFKSSNSLALFSYLNEITWVGDPRVEVVETTSYLHVGSAHLHELIASFRLGIFGSSNLRQVHERLHIFSRSFTFATTSLTELFIR
jgi:hypothetical protein